MKYLEISVNTTQEGQELIADLLWQYSSYGVAVCSTDDILELINERKDTFDYLDDSLTYQKPSTIVKGYVEKDFDSGVIDKEIEELKGRAVIELGTCEISKREVDGDDWIEIWRKHYKPVTIGGIVIRPKWVEYETDKPTVVIDTNTAFGTGEHETTSLCVLFLQKYLKKGYTVMDVGTGSGILGIASAKLGAKKVFMTELDPQAVLCAKHNVEVNDVEKICEVAECDLLEKANGKCDLLLANITAEILLRLVKSVNGYVKKDSVVILSGILKDRLDKVRLAYESEGFKTLEYEISGEWSALALEKESE